jgi:hypothetical protein
VVEANLIFMRQRLAGEKVELDLTRFPVVHLTEQGILHEGERVAVMDALDEIIDRRGRHALVLDLTRSGPLPESQRVYIAENWRMRTPEICEKRAALALVVRAPLLNHIAVAAYWMRVSPVPAKVFTVLEEASAWARSHALRTHSGELPVLGLSPVNFRSTRQR